MGGIANEPKLGNCSLCTRCLRIVCKAASMRTLTRLIQLGRSCPASLSVFVSNGILRSHRSTTVGRQCYSTNSGDNSQPISRYPIPYTKDLPYDMVELMEEVERKGGFLPNVFKAMAHRPNEFRAFFAYYDCIMTKETGNLSKADKELIIVATSAYNRCPYCVTAHGALHRIYSKKRSLADQVAVNWDLADLNQREHAMVEFALAVAKPENITDHHFQKLEKHGFDREDAWDIASITAFFAMANRMAFLMELRPNEEFHMLGRIPKVKE